MTEVPFTLREIGKWIDANRDAGHEEVAAKFTDWVRRRLNYSLDERTLRLAEAKGKGIPDIQCKDLNEKTIIVIEIKTDSDHIEKAANRKHIEQDQLERYLTDNMIDPAYLILTDGVSLYFYENRNRTLHLVKDLSAYKLSSISESTEQRLIALCARPEIDYLKKALLVAYLGFLKTHPQHLDSKQGVEFFVRNFALVPSGCFGKLVESCLVLMDYLENRSKFFQGAYEFWSRTFFHEVETLPNTWKVFLRSIGYSLGTKEDKTKNVQKFEFALETAYNIFSRLIMAKAIEDLKFHEVVGEVSSLDKYIGDLEFRRGVTNPIYYGLALVKLTERMREGFVRSIFEMDIFDWWVDAFGTEDGRSDLEKMGFSEVERVSDARLTFSKSIMQLFGRLYVFDFSQLGEDLYGLLYQAYFDKDTRKALGEFYTPREIVNFILDCCGYIPGFGERPVNRRLIDPACGSGTFIVEAIKRFLKDARMAKVPARDALDRLCNRVHVVGLDIHPFAAQLAKLNFILHILPTYRNAVKEDKSFVIKHIPIYRTDSLYNEPLATEKGRLGQTSLESTSEIKALEFGIPLPIKGEDGRFINLILELPERRSVQQGLQLDEEEYFDVLHATFAAIKKLAENREVDTQLHEKIESLGEVQTILMELPKLSEPKKELKKFDDIRALVKKGFGQNIFEKNKTLLKMHSDNLLTLKEHDYQDVVYHSLIKYISQLDLPDVREKILRQLNNSLRDQGFKNVDYDRIAEFFYPYCFRILLDVKYLKYKFGDGRLISSIEDRIVSILLKHYFRYNVVVANPPYVRIQRIVRYDPRLRDHYEMAFPKVAKGNYDLYIPFIAQGLNLLLKGGSLGYICSNRFATVNYGEGIREFIPEKATVRLFMDFRDTGVFKEVLNYPAVFVLEKLRDANPIACCRMREKPEDRSDEDVLSEIRVNLPEIRTQDDHRETEIFDLFGFDPSRLSKDGWYFMPYEEQLVFDHLRQRGKLLSEFTESSKSGSALFEGSSTGNRNVYIVQRISERDNKVSVLCPTDQKIWEIEKDATRLYMEDAGKWVPPISKRLLILPYRLGRDNHYEIIPPDEMQSQFPLAWKYLKEHEEILRARKGFKDREDWYAYSAPRSLEDYEQDKFLVQGFTTHSSVSMDTGKKAFFGPDIYGLRLRKLRKDCAKVLLAILNSKLTDFFVKHVGVIHGSGYYKFEDRFVKELPIKIPKGKAKDDLVDMVTQISKLSSKSFPEDFIEEAETRKIGSMVGEADFVIRGNSVLVPFDGEVILIQQMQKDLQESVIIKLDKNSYIKCPSRAHWDFLEQCILENAEKHAGKVRITTSFLSNVFIPKRKEDMQRAVAIFIQNKREIEELEEDLDQAVFELYRVKDVNHEGRTGAQIVEHFLSRW